MTQNEYPSIHRSTWDISLKFQLQRSVLPLSYISINMFLRENQEQDFDKN